MNKISILYVIAIAALFLTGGCATVNTLDKTRACADDKVKSEVFAYSFEKVYDAALKACEDLKLKVYSQDRKEGKIYAKSNVRWVSVALIMLGYGEKSGIYLTAIDEGSTKVDVVVQKSFSADIGYADWRGKILKSVKENLEKQ